jgi:hypothetical protein
MTQEENTQMFDEFPDENVVAKSDRKDLPYDAFTPVKEQKQIGATKTQTPVVSAKSEIALSETGAVQFKTVEEQFRMAKAYLSSGMLPKHYTKPEQIMTAMQWALELGLKPLSALRQIAVINGTPALFGDLPLSLVMKSGLLEGIEEALIDKGGQPIANNDTTTEYFGAICRVKRKGLSTPKMTSFTIDDAKKAGLFDKAGPWKTYPKRMLQCRARAQALKDLFPDVLMGADIAEYNEFESMSPNPSKAAELNSLFSSESGTPGPDLVTEGAS